MRVEKTIRSTGALAALALILAAAGCSKPEGRQESPASRPQLDVPTVVVVTIDTLRADRLGCYGHPDAGTPAVDGLASGGALLTMAQTTAPLTLPAHTSILTGRTLPAHGVINNGTFALPAQVPTLAEAFQEAGYATGAFVSSPVLARRYGLARGFDEYDDRVPRLGGRRGLVVHYPERPAVKTVARAVEWLMDQGSRPAFVWVHLWEPHAPYRPPAPFAERFGEDRYQGEVAAADAGLARLLEGIRVAGREGKLLIAVTADHGEGLGAHGEPTHGVFLYQETMHVPLVIHGPAFGIEARRIDAPVSLADLAPTLLDLMGLPPLTGADGASLAGILAGEQEASPRAVFAESHLSQLEFGWSGLRAVVEGGTKMIEAPRPELYDLRRDPAEQEDLAPKERGRVEELSGVLATLVRRAAASAPDTSSAHSASEEDLDVLRSLGYAASGRAGGGAVLVEPEGVDPKDRVEFIKRHDEAVGMMRTGKLPEAIETFEQLAVQDPDNPSVLLQLGQAQIMAQRFDDALVTFRRAVEVDPDFALAWYRLGQLEGHQKNYAGEEAAYRQAIAKDPFNIEARKALAGVLARQKKIQAAIDTLEHARDLDPTDPAIRAELEKLWARLRR